MGRWLVILGGLWLGLMACAPSEEDVVVPTLYDLPTWTPSHTPMDSPRPLASPSLTPSQTWTPKPQLTLTPPPSPTTSPSMTPTPVQAAVIRPDGAPLYEGPGREFAVVGQLADGQRASVLAYSLNAAAEIWFWVRLTDGQTAWIAAADAPLADGARPTQIAERATPRPTYTATASLVPSVSPTPALPQGANATVSGELGLNLRAGAGYGYEIQTVLDTGDPLVIIGRNSANSWYQVVTFEAGGGRVGWVDASLVAPLVDTAALAVTWQGPARMAGVACGMNVQPRDGIGDLPIPTDIMQIEWVRFPFLASPQHFPSLEAAFAYFDPIIESYRAGGVNVILVLTHQTYGEQNGWDWMTMTSAEWQRFTPNFVSTVQRVAAHYGDRVAAYEIWNEGDVPPGNEAAVAISPVDYAPLLRDSARAIRQVAPGSRILLGGVLDPSGDYVRQVQAALGGQLPVDAIAIHPYGRGAPTYQSVFGRLGAITEVIAAYERVAPGLPLWLTEIGAAGDNSPGRWAEASRYMESLIQYLRSRHADRVEMVVWYAWSDGMHPSQAINGLVTVDNQPKYPIYDAFFNLCG